MQAQRGSVLRAWNTARAIWGCACNPWFFFPLIGWGIGLTMHFLFGVLWVRSETENWQSRVELRAREIHA